jgi:N-acetylglucosamine-6-phosphate deacetylase
MDQALRNLVFELGLPLPEAARRVSTYAARYLGLADRGALVVGASADLVLLDTHLLPTSALIEGEAIEGLADAARGTE